MTNNVSIGFVKNIYINWQIEKTTEIEKKTMRTEKDLLNSKNIKCDYRKFCDPLWTFHQIYSFGHFWKQLHIFFFIIFTINLDKIGQKP